MLTRRLPAAIEALGPAWPSAAPLLVIDPPADLRPDDLAGATALMVQPFKPAFDRLSRDFLHLHPSLPAALAAAPAPPQAALVCLPRARAQAEWRIGKAAAAVPAGAPVLVDGARGGGIDAIRRALAARVPEAGHVARAHGKLIWFLAPGESLEDGARDDPKAGALADWAARAADWPHPPGWRTGPGLFSADGLDPGSAALAAALPALRGRVADLGAGWGGLCRAVLASPEVAALTLVEACHRSLDAARQNLDDPRASFVWADATAWRPDARFDAVVMNPPFHDGGRGDPGIGRDFIATAAAILEDHGTLWMVANRHLPYEAALGAAFRETSEIPGGGGFKILRAARPARGRGRTRRRIRKGA